MVYSQLRSNYYIFVNNHFIEYFQLAPEIVRGDKVYDKAVDLWSVGVITYVLYVNRAIFFFY